jgi:hypothetical protein
LAGQSLGHWRSLYGVFRRPQNGRDRLAVRTAASITGSPRFVSSLTRVVLDADHTLVFLTLSAVNPHADGANRRYVAYVWSAVRGQGTSSQSLAPGVQLPLDVLVGSASLDYSIVPDNVAKVAWYYRCSSGCGQLSASPLVLRAHDNVAHAVITAGAWNLDRVTWYLRDGARPLHYNAR